jgi:hypothetical protein
MRLSVRKLWLALAGCAWAVTTTSPTTASAQHADFVLFGSKNPDKDAPANNEFVAPVTTPYFHEDSFITTDLRAWFVYHRFPKDGLIDGGSAKDYAVQIRLALTDQLQFVAYKDGYIDFDSGLIDDSGWNDIAAGLKWNFLQDFKSQLHASAGVGYQFAFGDASVLQNDQELRVWASVNKGFGPLHLGATVNGLFATGSEDSLGNSDRLLWHVHADYYVNKYFSPVVELNGFHVIDEGNVVAPFSGVDVANLGGGSDVVTLGLGAEFRPIEPLGLRGAYELPLTDGDDLYGWRLTFSAIYKF